MKQSDVAHLQGVYQGIHVFVTGTVSRNKDGCHRRRARSGRTAIARPIICQKQNLKYLKMIKSLLVIVYSLV